VNNFDDLVALLVSDKVKQCISVTAQNHVADRENDGRWLKPTELSDVLDCYEAQRNCKVTYNKSNSTYYANNRFGNAADNMQTRSNKNESGNDKANIQKKTFQHTDKDKIRCSYCSKSGHLALDCYFKKRDIEKGTVSKHKRTCYICKSAEHFQNDCPRRNTAFQNYRNVNRVTVNATTEQTVDNNDATPTAFEVKRLVVNHDSDTWISSEAVNETGTRLDFADVDTNHESRLFSDNADCNVADTCVTLPTDLCVKLKFCTGFECKGVIDSGSQITS